MDRCNAHIYHSCATLLYTKPENPEVSLFVVSPIMDGRYVHYPFSYNMVTIHIVSINGSVGSQYALLFVHMKSPPVPLWTASNRNITTVTF